MIHLFVESNWVVEVCAPVYRRSREALSLLGAARRSEIALHIPSVALREGRSVVQRKYQPKESGTLQAFRKWLLEQGAIDAARSATVNEFLAAFSDSVTADLEKIDRRVREIAETPGLEVFALSEPMLNKALELREEVSEPELKPFDEAILAAVLVRGQELSTDGPLLFCTKDRDLVPLDRANKPRVRLQAAYAAIGMEVRTTFDFS